MVHAQFASPGKALSERFLGAVFHMSQQPTRRDRTEQAYLSYLDLVDTADLMQRELAAQLALHGLTMNEFRLLLLLFSQGPLALSDAARARGCHLWNLKVMVARMAHSGWLRTEVTRRPPAFIKQSELPAARRGRPRKGYRVVAIVITPKGEQKIAEALPVQTKLVKARMRVLTMREQKAISRLCRKLREPSLAATWRFLREMRMKDAPDELLLMSPKTREWMRNLTASANG
jgi:DNA-binding MarR family transcriptional regulator